MEYSKKQSINARLRNIVTNKFQSIKSNSTLNYSKQKSNDRKLNGMIRNYKSTLKSIKNIKNPDDYYRFIVGPGSYNVHSNANENTTKGYYVYPMYSMRIKDNYKKLFISKELQKDNLGYDSPGVGKYYSGAYPKSIKANKIPIAKKRNYNFEINNGAPGPIYSSQTIEDIGCPQRTQLAPSFHSESQRKFEFSTRLEEDNIQYRRENNSSLHQILRGQKKGFSIGPEQDKFHKLWIKSLVLAKKERVIVPGPGAYSNIIIQKSNNKSYSIPKSKRNFNWVQTEKTKVDNYNVSDRFYLCKKKDSNLSFKFPKFERNCDVRKWAISFF